MHASRLLRAAHHKDHISGARSILLRRSESIRYKHTPGHHHHHRMLRDWRASISESETVTDMTLHRGAEQHLASTSNQGSSHYGLWASQRRHPSVHHLHRLSCCRVQERTLRCMAECNPVQREQFINLNSLNLGILRYALALSKRSHHALSRYSSQWPGETDAATVEL